MFGCERGDTLWAPVDGASISAFASLAGSVSEDGVFAHSYLIHGCVGTSFIYALHNVRGVFTTAGSIPGAGSPPYTTSGTGSTTTARDCRKTCAYGVSRPPRPKSQRQPWRPRSRPPSACATRTSPSILRCWPARRVLANERRIVGEGEDDEVAIGLDPGAEGTVGLGPTTCLYEKPAFEETIPYNLDTDGDGGHGDPRVRRPGRPGFEEYRENLARTRAIRTRIPRTACGFPTPCPTCSTGDFSRR